MNAIITGASGGIGEATLRVFAQNGINVWACCSKKNEAFEGKLNQIAEENNVWIKPVPFSLEDEAAVREGIKTILSDKKDIDILVNNAGVSPRKLLMMMPVSELRRTMEINYISSILIVQLVARKMMRQKSGSIINVGSVSGCLYADDGAYGASKAALIHSTRVMAKELADYNIRVNSVSPGFIGTSMWTDRSEEMLKEGLERSVMKRMGEPEEVANVIYFLSSDKASYMTGQNVVIDGGG